MTRPQTLSISVLLALAAILLTGFDHQGPFWPQWGRNPQHTGMVNVPAQSLNEKLADIIYDPFVKQEVAENGGFGLAVHYQSTLIDGNSFFMLQKSGKYPSCHPVGNWQTGAHCGPNAWNELQWNVVRYDWKHGQAVSTWTFPTDWKPEPNAGNYNLGYLGLEAEEPVFHPALAHGHLYVPGAGGTLWKVDRHSGKAEAHINPFAGMNIHPAVTFVAGPLSADEDGDIYYNVIELNTKGNPWDQNDVAGAWLVKVAPDDTAITVTFATLVPNAPPGNSTNCPGTFFNLNDNGASLPWPPTPTSVPPTELCGSQRPGVNVAPAIARDGTVYTVSRAHFDNMVSYLVAVNPDLTPKWATSLQNLLSDGCGALLPIAHKGVTNEPNSCRYGTTVGVDPTTNATGSGEVFDQGTASPTVLPDDSLLFGVLDNYNYFRGHLLHFDPAGNFLNQYIFGWDYTPGVYTHDHTYSIVVKNNTYGVPAYCFFNNPVCGFPPLPGPYLVTQLDAGLNVEWSFKNTTIDQNHPNGFEWCVNSPVIDRTGLVYALSEDAHLYSIPQGHKGVFTTPHQKILLKEQLPAAYTPLSIGEDGKVYSQNAGHLLVVGR
jgi:hypothetical protein